MTQPVISIITPSFNHGNYLEETILSVVEQKYTEFEYIVIDLNMFSIIKTLQW